jgi:DNA-binding CsgD family transcriptional regulator/PAS domain-containing protein
MRIISILLFLLPAGALFSHPLLHYQGASAPLEFSICEMDSNSITNIPEAALISRNDLDFHDYHGEALPKTFAKSVYIFQTKFILSCEGTNDTPMLTIGPMDYPYHIYLNGEMILMMGNTSPVYTSTIFRSFAVQLPCTVVSAPYRTNTLSVIVFPQYERMQLGDIILTSYRTAYLDVFLRNLFNVNLITASVLLAIMIGIYSMLIFFLSGRTEKRLVYYTGLTVSFALSYLTILLTFNYNNEVLNEIFSRGGMLFGVPFFALYLTEELKVFNGKKWLAAVLLFIPSVFSVIIALQTTKQDIRTFFYIGMYAVIFPTALFTVAVMILSIIKKTASFLVMVSGFSIYFFVMYDSIMLVTNRLPYCWLTPYGFILLELSIFYKIAVDYGKLNRNLIIKTNALDMINENLSQIVEQKTSKLEEEMNLRFIAEQESLNSQKLLLQTFAGAPFGVLILNTELIVTYVNTYFLQKLQMNERDVIGKAYLDFIEDRDKIPSIEKLRDILENEKNGSFQEIVRIQNTHSMVIDAEIHYSTHFTDEFVNSRIFCYIKELSAEKIKRKREKVILDEIKQIHSRFDNIAELIKLQETDENSVKLSDFEITDREREIIFNLLDGRNNQEIAARLFLSESTVKGYINSIYKKLDVKNRGEFFAFFKDRVIF